MAAASLHLLLPIKPLFIISWSMAGPITVISRTDSSAELWDNWPILMRNWIRWLISSMSVWPNSGFKHHHLTLHESKKVKFENSQPYLRFLVAVLICGVGDKLISWDDNVEIDLACEKISGDFSVNNTLIRWRIKPLLFNQFPTQLQKGHGTKNNHPQMLEGRGADIHQAHCHPASHS